MAEIERHEQFFRMIEDGVRARFSRGDRGEEEPRVVVYRTGQEEPYGTYPMPMDPRVVRTIIGEIRSLPEAEGVGYVHEEAGVIIATFHARDADRAMTIKIVDQGGTRTLGEVTRHPSAFYFIDRTEEFVGQVFGIVGGQANGSKRRP